MSEQTEHNPEDQANSDRVRAERGEVFDAIERHVHRQGIRHPDMVEAIMERVMDELDGLTTGRLKRPAAKRGFELIFGDATEPDTWATVLNVLKRWTVTVNGGMPEVFVEVGTHPDTGMVAIQLKSWHNESVRWVQYDELKSLEIH